MSLIEYTLQASELLEKIAKNTHKLCVTNEIEIRLPEKLNETCRGIEILTGLLTVRMKDFVLFSPFRDTAQLLSDLYPHLA